MDTVPHTKLIILGSTGSIGTQTIEIARQYKDRIELAGLSAKSNWKLLAAQVNEFHPEFAYLSDVTHKKDFEDAVVVPSTKLLFSESDLLHHIMESEADLVMNSLVGFSGFMPTVAALESGKRVALANKESLVVGGELLKGFLNSETPSIFPVDSEHSAIYQCLLGESGKAIEKLIITASGGPFRSWKTEDLHKVTVESALKHPNWDMGAKITIDSATMMNKGLEVIEARWLFDLEIDQIEAVIHPQSIIHSMVTFVDGSTKAQLGLPDMKVPIQYAISYPHRWPSDTPRVDWTQAQQWTFEPVDVDKFRCYALALNAMTQGGHSPTVLNAANEIAVQRFLNKEIPYIAISQIVERCLEQIDPGHELTVHSIKETDHQTRAFAKKMITHS